MRKTIFLTGGNGQVGFELARSLASIAEVHAPPRDELDLEDTAAVRLALERQQPDLIVNAAAFTAVDQAETDIESARRLNAELPKALAEYARRADIPLIHYSTDYVYPGSGDQPWTEDSPTAPLNVYGETKLQGDQAIQHAQPEHLIFRTSWVYAARGGNFLNTMLRLGQSKPALRIIDDQIGAPTPARLIADITLLALTRGPRPTTAAGTARLGPAIPSGVYHLAPRGETSWHGFAQAIFQMADARGVDLALNPTDATPIPTSEYPTPATRPLNSRLALSKLESALGVELPPWKEQLRLVVAEALDPARPAHS